MVVVSFKIRHGDTAEFKKCYDRLTRGKPDYLSQALRKLTKALGHDAKRLETFFRLACDLICEHSAPTRADRSAKRDQTNEIRLVKAVCRNADKLSQSIGKFHDGVALTGGRINWKHWYYSLLFNERFRSDLRALSLAAFEATLRDAPRDSTDPNISFYGKKTAPRLAAEALILVSRTRFPAVTPSTCVAVICGALAMPPEAVKQIADDIRKAGKSPR